MTWHLHDDLESCSLRTQTYFRLSLVPPKISDSRKYVCVRRLKELVVMVKKVTYFGELGCLNSSCLCIISMSSCSPRDKFPFLWQNSVTDVSVGFRLRRQHVVSIQISTNSGKKNFSAISHIYLLSLPRFWTLSIESV